MTPKKSDNPANAQYALSRHSYSAFTVSLLTVRVNRMPMTRCRYFSALVLYCLSALLPAGAASLDFKGTLATPFLNHPRGATFNATIFFDPNASSFESGGELGVWQQEHYPFQQVAIVIEDQLYQVNALEQSALDNRIRIVHCQTVTAVCTFDEISLHANGEVSGQLDAPRIQFTLRGNAGWLKDAHLPDTMALRELMQTANQASMTLQSDFESSSLRIER